MQFMEMKAKLEEARKSFETCKRASEWFAVKKLFDGTDRQSDYLREELGKISPGQVNVGDKEKTELIQEINKGLAELARDANEYLKTVPGQEP